MRLVLTLEEGGVVLQVAAPGMDDTAQRVAQALGTGLYHHLSRDEPGYTSVDTSALPFLIKAGQTGLTPTPSDLAALGWVARAPRFGTAAHGGLWTEPCVAIHVPLDQGGGGNGPYTAITHCEVHLNPAPADLPALLDRLQVLGVQVVSVRPVKGDGGAWRA
jgi:hypothetical protein